MEDDIEESIYDYLTEGDLQAVLPIYWINCGKIKKALRKKLINDYQMSRKSLLDEAVSEIVDAYDYKLKFKEDMGWDPDEWPMDGSYNIYHGDLRDDLDEEALVDIWLIQQFEDDILAYKEDQAYRQRSSGLFFSVREADGEYVFNMVGWLGVIGGIFLIGIIASAFS